MEDYPPFPALSCWVNIVARGVQDNSNTGVVITARSDALLYYENALLFETPVAVGAWLYSRVERVST